VVGVLLGQDNGKTINVANSFGIPFEEDERDSKTWFLDHNYIDGMYEMFKKVNGTCSTFLGGLERIPNAILQRENE
jgi:tRNA splicing ligase